MIISDIFLRLIRNKNGKIIVSILWGLGIACLFRKMCNDQTCLVYTIPKKKEMISNVFLHHNKCFKYNMIETKCKA